MMEAKLKNGINSFGHLLNRGECLSFEGFAERIASVYDLRNPETNLIYRLLCFTDGTIENTAQGLCYHYKPESLDRACRTVNEKYRRVTT